MRICYIKEKQDTCDFIKKIIVMIKKLFNIIEKEEEKQLIYYLPIFKNTKLSKCEVNRLSRKIVRNLEKDGIQDIVLSKYLGTIELLKLELYSQNINILDGRILFKCLIPEIIEYILKRKKKKMQERRDNIIS